MEDYIPCSRFSCHAILQSALGARLQYEQSDQKRVAVDACLSGLKNYLMLYNTACIEKYTFRHRIGIHLRELEKYIEDGKWERIYE